MTNDTNTEIETMAQIINKLTGEQVKDRNEVIDVFTCCGRHVHETPQGVFDDANGKQHQHDTRLPDDLIY